MYVCWTNHYWQTSALFRKSDLLCCNRRRLLATNRTYMADFRFLNNKMFTFTYTEHMYSASLILWPITSLSLILLWKPLMFFNWWIKVIFGGENVIVFSIIHFRKVANVAFNDLPSSRSCGGRYSCDVCTKNGVFLQAAKVFCTVCSLMYCAKHEKVGDCFVHLASLSPQSLLE